MPPRGMNEAPTRKDQLLEDPTDFEDLSIDDGLGHEVSIPTIENRNQGHETSPEQPPRKQLSKWPVQTDDSGTTFVNTYQKLVQPAVRKELAPYLPYIEKAPIENTSSHQEPLASHLKRKPWIDFNDLKDWIKTCNRYHGHHCSNTNRTLGSPWHGPQWLIDVIARCLVPAEHGMHYVALSYVWGSSAIPDQHVHLQKSTLQKLCTSNALRNTKMSPSVVPRLIDDAIELVARLGERYLWIDRYCIVQDDGPAKDSQIGAMNTIYAGAFLTIVASDSTASTGIRGIKGHSEERLPRTSLDYLKDVCHKQIARGRKSHSEFRPSPSPTPSPRPYEGLEEMRSQIHESEKQNPQPVDYDPSIYSYDSFVISDGARQQKLEQRGKDRKVLETQAYLLLHTPWYDRGWTFQEALFSRRKIIIQNDTVNWECHCTAWYEGQEDRSERQCTKRPGFNTDGGFDSASWPDLYRYARLVALFNRRKLTFPEDALYAFAGVLSSLSRTFKFGFVSGLPQMFFHSTLIWQPYRPMLRRLARDSDDAILPTWSWVGWQSTFQSESWRSGYGYVKSLATEQDLPKTSWKTYETVKWYRRDDGGRKHSIKSSETRQGAEVPAAEEGWSKHFDPQSETMVWHHKTIPDTEFWRPVALRDPIKAHVPPIYCRYIAASTRMARVMAGDTFQNTQVSGCACVDLLDNASRWVGVLRLHGSGPPLADYEIIELSAGSVKNVAEDSNTVDEEDRTGFREEMTNSDGKYDFYNVMAITRDDGKAYREAVGRIVKSAWDEMDSEVLEVVLA